MTNPDYRPMPPSLKEQALRRWRHCLHLLAK
jgi:hypothetical protein